VNILFGKAKVSSIFLVIIEFIPLLENYLSEKLFVIENEVCDHADIRHGDLY